MKDMEADELEEWVRRDERTQIEQELRDALDAMFVARRPAYSELAAAGELALMREIGEVISRVCRYHEKAHLPLP